MCQTKLIRLDDGQLFAYSFTTGVKKVEPSKHSMTEKDAVALFSRLVELGREDDAEIFLERWCR